MPTYEYICGNCGKFEEYQPITSSALKECPKCGSPVTRVISGGSGLIFKGSGFYITDNRSSDYKSREKAEKAEKIGKTDKNDKTDKAAPAPAPALPVPSNDSGAKTGGEKKGSSAPVKSGESSSGTGATSGEAKP